MNAPKYALSAAARADLALDIIEDNTRILAIPCLSAEERPGYEQSTVEARIALGEAQAELLLAPPAPVSNARWTELDEARRALEVRAIMWLCHKHAGPEMLAVASAALEQAILDVERIRTAIHADLEAR